MEDVGGRGDGGDGGSAALKSMPTLPVVRQNGGVASAIPAPPSTGGVTAWNAWGDAVAVRLRQATTEELPAARDVIGRMHRIAVEMGDQEAIVETSIAAERVKREIGQRHERKLRGGMPDRGKSEQSPTGRTLPKQTVADYRADAESLTNDGFEAVASAAVEASQPLDRRTVRAAGELERAGEDPGDAVQQPKRARVAGPARVHPEILMAVCRVLPDGYVVDGPIGIVGCAPKSKRVESSAVALSTGHRDEWTIGANDDVTDWRRHVVWVCPAVMRGLDRAWAQRILKEIDREEDDPRCVQLAIVGLGADMTPDPVQELLGHERLLAVAWPRREHAPVRTLMAFGAVSDGGIMFGAFGRDAILDAWSDYCAVACVHSNEAPAG